jgi:hypothetical protein
LIRFLALTSASMIAVRSFADDALSHDAATDHPKLGLNRSRPLNRSRCSTAPFFAAALHGLHWTVIS